MRCICRFGRHCCGTQCSTYCARIRSKRLRSPICRQNSLPVFRVEQQVLRNLAKTVLNHLASYCAGQTAHQCAYACADRVPSNRLCDIHQAAALFRVLKNVAYGIVVLETLRTEILLECALTVALIKRTGQRLKTAARNACRNLVGACVYVQLIGDEIMLSGSLASGIRQIILFWVNHIFMPRGKVIHLLLSRFELILSGLIRLGDAPAFI